MEPKSVSATALEVFNNCPARYKVEQIDRPPSMGSAPGDLGTACHAALEDYVQNAFLSGKPEPDEDESYLMKRYVQHYYDLFGDDTSVLGDGEDMLHRWWARTTFEDRIVLSTEQKESFPVPSSLGPIPLNYIWDRCDRLSNGDIEVVDYKTWRLPVQPDKLRDKIQVRVYALAARIKYPDADRIWVILDQLRYDAVGTSFTREDDVATWKFVKAKLEEIITSDGSEEKIGQGCSWCYRRHSCQSLNSAIASGSVSGVTVEQAVARKAELDVKLKTLGYMVDELDTIILDYAKEQDLLAWDSGDHKVDITMSSRRGVDAERAMQIIGPELSAKYGSMTVKAVDTLLKGSELTHEQKAQLKVFIGLRTGEPRPKVTPRNPIDEG